MTNPRAMPAADPWFWQTDDLINELCHSIKWYRATSCTASDLPSPSNLERQIHSKRLTGSLFLTESDSLDSEIVFESGHAAQKAALQRVVEMLRANSKGYQQHVATTSVKSHHVSEANEESQTHADETYNSEAGNHKRQKVAHITLPYMSRDPRATQDESANENWDYLLRWQEVSGHEEEVALIHESDINVDEQVAVEEDVEDVYEDGEEDVQTYTESLAPSKPRGKLSTEQVLDIINEEIEKYTNTWVPARSIETDEPINYDPQVMWEEAEAAGARQQFIKQYGDDQEYYLQRLDKLCDEIARDPASSIEGLRRQCRNLEITVHYVELADWLRSIYELDPQSGEEGNESDCDSMQNRDLSLRIPHGDHVLRPSQYTGQIIDLGSPPTSSNSGEEDQHETLEPVFEAEGISVQDKEDRDIRWHTPNSVIADAIEEEGSTNQGQDGHHANQRTQAETQPLHGDNPEQASITSVRRWEWLNLIQTLDRKRIISKMVYELATDERELIRTRLAHMSISSLIREVLAYVQMLVRGDTKMQGVLPRDQTKIEALARLYLSWWFCDNNVQYPLSADYLKDLRSCPESGLGDIRTFCDYLITIMTTTFSEDALQNPDRPSFAEVIEISSDEEDVPRASARNRTVEVSGNVDGDAQNDERHTIVLD